MSRAPHARLRAFGATPAVASTFALLAGCSSEPGFEFIERPELDPSTGAIIWAYLGRETLEVHAGRETHAFTTLESHEDGDLIQVVEYTESLEALGLEAGLVQAPTVACRRACALEGGSVHEVRRTAGAWTEWARGSIDQRLLERLLPRAERGRCRACTEFELTQVDVGDKRPARFILAERDRASVLLGMQDGRISRLDLEGRLETVCQLEAGFAAAAGWLSTGELVVSGQLGRIEVLDLGDGCSTMSSTVNPDRDLLLHVAVHPTTDEIYTVDSSGRIDVFSPSLGFRRVAEMGVQSSGELGGAVFDRERRLFVVNGTSTYAFGAETITVQLVEVPETVMDSPPLVRGVGFDAERDTIVATIENHGLFAVHPPSFELLASMAGEPGGVLPYRGGYLSGYKGGIVMQYAPEFGLCPELLVGARRSPRLLDRVGTRVVIGDAYIPRDHEETNARAVIMTPRDHCATDGSP